jgi:sugar transferase (PEP-CTERM system associated)
MIQARAINSWIRTPLLLMATVESLVLFSSLYVAAIITCGSVAECEQIMGAIVPRASLITALVLICLIAMGLYEFHQRLWYREAVLRVFVGLSAGFMAVAVVFYAFPGFSIERQVTNVAYGYSLVLLLAVRYYFVRTVDTNIFRRRTLIYGAGERAASLMDLRRRSDRRGFRIVGKVAAPGDTIVGDRSEVLNTNGSSIVDVALEKQADEIVIAMDEKRGNLPVRELLDARLQGVDVIELMEFLERETGKIRIDLVNPGWLIFSPGFRISRLRALSSRTVDVFVSGCLVAISWPVMLLIGACIKLEDGIRAPVFYRQCRVGKGGKHFEVLKFRSMSVDAEADGKAKWAEKNDGRITRVGNRLRNARLDELPQVFNVLRGQMSLVGPRPERPEFVEELREAIPYYDERHSVKPGVTGWAQLKYSYGASEEDAIEKLQYDLYYIKHQSLMLDIMIILQTVEVVLWGKGAR